MNDFFRKKEYYGEEIDEVKRLTGFNLRDPEKQMEFVNVVDALTYVETHPDYFDMVKESIKKEGWRDRPAYVTIRNLRNFCGEEYAKHVISIAVADLCNYFNINKNMNFGQIKETAEIIVKDMYLNWLSIAQVADCFDKIKAGAYGVIYDRLDGNVICEKLYKYHDKLNNRC